ncbi:hypothetical protein DKG79_26350 (plasmid) [Escherichia fergusonii]|nr:hypothetical protein DKG79_26350 [Escherichia fergusonii]
MHITRPWTLLFVRWSAGLHTVMTDGQSETVLTGNLVMALFNHDTSRDQEPQLHTHAW